jgi:metal-dependent hydrolase (beta-lactamase superfamily II)
MKRQGRISVQVSWRSLLFDTGQSDLLVKNARNLHVPLDRVEAVALSHGHDDHTGGMHLRNASSERMEKTCAALRHLGVQRLAPCHCTGIPAQAQLWSALPGRCSSCGVGKKLTFQA